MTRFKTLILGAAVGVLLAVVGIAAVIAALDPSAAEMATEMANQSNPGEPPPFYGVR